MVNDRAKYDDKMKQMLSDKSIYMLLSHNPLNRLENRSNCLVDKMFEAGEIDWIKKARMRKHNTQLPRIYALPK